MAELPATPATIRCHACGFENTTTSLYCQDCGVRLVAPPSAVAEKAPATATTPAPAAPSSPVTPKKPRILSSKRAKAGPPVFFLLVRTLVIAALAALVIQIIRPPASLPPPVAPLPDNVAVNVRATLQLRAQQGAPFDAPWSGQGLNAYLAAVLRPGPAAGAFQVSFQRAVLSPIAGGFSLFVERKIGSLNLYSRVDYQLVARGNGISATPVGAALGRLPLPAFAAPLVESLNGSLGQALASELGILREAKSIRITAQRVYIDFGSSQP